MNQIKMIQLDKYRNKLRGYLNG